MNTSTEKNRNIVKMLRQKGITPTTQRVKIAAVLLAKPQHLTADQALDLANREGRKVSKATVYNTLRLFSEKGLIKELNIDPTRAFYDSTTHAHHHFYNMDTRELSDIAPEEVEISLPRNLPEGTEIDKAEMVVFLRNKFGE